MMPAAKHGDVQMGVDIHLCMVPTPAPTPTPLPTPHMSVVFDPFDYVPVIGATITVCGMKRATAGTAGKVVHIPPGFPFAPKLPDTEDELFMGSSTVVADGDPMSHISHPVLSCQAAGMMSPFRLKKKGGPRAMVLPTVFNLATPTTVFVGGPPTISLMGMAMKGVFAGLGKLAKSGVFKRLRQKLFKNLKPGFLKCTVLRAEPVNILNGAVSLEQQDFQLPGRIDVDWLRCYSSADRHVGVCGTGWQTLLDIRLEVDAADGSVMLHGPGIGPLAFERLPAAPGAAGMQLELTDGARLTDDGDEWQVRTKDGRIHCFPKHLAQRTAEGGGLVPIGRITDRCGNALTIDYRNGLPHALTEAAGRRLALTMQDGRLVAVTLVDEATRTEHGFVRYDYDAAGDLVAAIDALGAPYRFAYGGGATAHHLVRHTNRVGLSFHYQYEPGPDGSQRVVHSWGDGGLYDYRFQYLDALNERRITDSLGHVSLVKLDDRGLPINEIDPLGGMTVYEYDDAGRTTAVVDPAGRRTAWTYDERGNVLRIERPDGSMVSSVFDADDRPVEALDALGARWQRRFDERGGLLQERSPLGHLSRQELDAHGQVVAQVDALGRRTALRYDACGLPSEVVDAAGGRSTLLHDVLGRLHCCVDAAGQRTDYQHDALGRLTAARLPSGATVRCEWDAEGRLSAYVDELGARTLFSYCGLGQLCRRLQPDGGVVAYLYDTEERLVGVRNARGELYALQRDALGRIVAETDYWGHTRRHGYDAGGHTLWSQDAHQQRVRHECDPVGRVLTKLSQDPFDAARTWRETYAYDANGQLLEAANPHVVLRRELDAEGRLLTERQQHADGTLFSVQQVHDAVGNRLRRITRLQLPAEAGREAPAEQVHEVLYAYDALNRCSGVHIDGQAQVLMQRDAAGRLAAEQLGHGLQRRYEHDPVGRLRAQGLWQGDTLLQATSHAFDAAGRLVAREDSLLGSERWQLDPMGRIRQHLDALGQVHVFARDAAGERMALRPVQAGGRAGQREGSVDGIAWRLDAAGDLVQRHEAGVGLQLHWDGSQRLVASRREQGGHHSTTVYGYDPLGRRLFKQTGGLRTRFGWDGDLCVADAVAGRVRTWVHRPDGFEPLAQLEQPAGAATASLAWVLDDLNGAAAQLRAPDGRCLWAAGYDAHGRARIVEGEAAACPLRLQGQYFDEETGLAYNRHRYFDAALGQFISIDPLRLAAGDQLYAMAGSVFDWIDPLGLSCKALSSLTDEQFLKEIAARAERYGIRNGLGAAGTGAVQGTKKHAHADHLLERYQRLTGQRTHLLRETSFLGGVQVPHGTKGSARPDVFDPLTGNIYDYKFVGQPGQGLRASQVNKNAANVPGVVRQVEINP
ncbi:MAG: RHS repeat-associated core domain-containing protein [Aquincola tertiaricarbonis]